MPSNATTAPPDTDHALACLRRHERRFRTRWFFMMVLGMIAIWIGPVLAATLLWVLEFHAGGIPDSWSYLFAWCIGIIPFLFLMEWMTRGAFMDDAVDGMGGAGNMSASFGHRQWASLALLTEISLWGPRITLAAVNRLSRAARLGRNPQPAAAKLLAILLGRDEGLRCAIAMTRSGLNADDFGDGLAYLLFHEWVDLSKDGLFVWLLSDARRRIG